MFILALIVVFLFQVYGTPTKIANLRKQIAAYRDLSTSLALDLQPAARDM